MNHDSNEWVSLYRTRSEEDCRENILVLQALGIEYRVHREADELTLEVAATDAERSRAELAAYGQENHDRSIVRSVTPQRGGGWSGVLGFAVVLVLTALLEQRHTFGLDWLAAGRAHAGLIREGEWWRTVTALTLHVDSAHLLSNLVVGGIVGLFVGRSCGSGLSWCGVLIAGALGNLLNAWVRPPDHTSVGASTAVFAVLGLLAANAWWQRRTLQTSWLERWTPLVGGVILLSFLGTGGGRTDVTAHVFGFLWGIPFGALCAKLANHGVSTRRANAVFGLAAIVILAIAWALALARYRT